MLRVLRRRLRAPARLVLLAGVLGIGGCAARPSASSIAPAEQLRAAGELGDCARLFAALDRLIDDAGVRDAQDTRIPGFPYLRVNRFLASDLKPSPHSSAFPAWVEQLQELDQTARHIELANAQVSFPVAGAPEISSELELRGRVVDCRSVLRGADLAQSVRRERLHAEARVPDDYHIGQRLFGAYAFTAWGFLAGVADLYEESRATFSGEIGARPVVGRLSRYQPPAGESLTAEAVEALLARARDNQLRIPLPDRADRAALFAHFAPVFEVDVRSDDDRIGAPALIRSSGLHVDTATPVVYRHMSHARFQGESLLQLNYVIWFPARPLSGPLDLYGGVLDGITWRVTLDSRGRPLLYDAMHNCGCFHQFFGIGRLVQQPPGRFLKSQSLSPSRYL